MQGRIRPVTLSLLSMLASESRGRRGRQALLSHCNPLGEEPREE